MSNTKGMPKDDKDDDGKNKKQTVTVHHYTSKKGVEAILKSGVIKESQASGRYDDAYFGDGAYVTGMAPEKGKQAIARNNYDSTPSGAQSKIDAGRVDYAIRVEVPAHNLVKEKAGGRDVQRHDGPIDLNDHKFSVHKVPDKASNIKK